MNNKNVLIRFSKKMTSLVWRKKASKEKPTKNLVVTEGIAGYWHYHLSSSDETSMALCGSRTMPTKIQLEYFRKILKTKRERRCDGMACKKCTEMAGF